MTIIAVTLAVLLVAVLALATVAVRSRNETITALKGEVIVRTLAVREARRQRDKAEQMLDDTEQARGLAKEIIDDMKRPGPWSKQERLHEYAASNGPNRKEAARELVRRGCVCEQCVGTTPLFDGLVADAEQREATVLEFRRSIPDDLGGVS